MVKYVQRKFTKEAVMKKFSKKLVALLLAAVMLCSVLPFSVFAEEGGIIIKNGKYTAEKISNPTTGEGKADGLMPGGDRLNSYAWCMEQLGDYIYIGTNRNIMYYGVYAFLQTLEDQGVDPEMVNAMVKMVTNDEIPTDCQLTDISQARIFRYNTKTKEMETFFNSEDYITEPDGSPYKLVFGFRAAKAYKGAIYMNAMTNFAKKSVIYRITNDMEKPEVVNAELEDGTVLGGATNLRAMALSEDQNTFYIGGTTPVNQGSSDAYNIAVYKTEDGQKFKTIADFTEPVFRRYQTKEYWADPDGDVWDMVEYDGELYLTLMTKLGAVVFKGHQAKTNETGNKYGWVWKEMAGDGNENLTDSHYGIGFGNPLNYATTPYIFKDQVYFITFSNAMDSLILGGQALMKVMSGAGTINDYFEALIPCENSLNNQTSVFRMGKDGQVEMVVGDREKAQEAGIAYNGELGPGFDCPDRMTVYNWRAAVYNDKLYVGTMDGYSIYKYLTKLTNGELLDMSADKFRQQLIYVKELLEKMSETNIKDVTPETLSNSDSQTEDIPKTQEDEKVIAAQAYEATPQVEKKVVEDTEKQTAEALSDEFQPETTEAVEKLDDKVIDDIIDVLVMIQQSLDKEATTDSIYKALESIPEAAEQLTKIQRRLGYLCWRYRHHPVLYKVLRTAHDTVKQVADQLNAVDHDGLERYIRISKIVGANEHPGFELYSTKDGINYDPVTLNGFNDKYNYGVRTLVPTEKGLFLGTANPFYGAQLWKITDGDEKKPQPTPDPTPVNPEVKKVNTGLQATDTTMPAVLGLSLTALLITGLFIWTKRKAVK